MASGGWPGLSGRHGRRGARRNRGVARQNRPLPARDRARKGWAWWGHGGTGSPPLRGHRQNFTKALRAAGRPPVASRGWPGFSGGHGGGVPDGIGLCPLATFLQGLGTGWARWNWLAACAGASSEFYEGSPSRREGGSASLEAMGGGVHDGIGALPDGIGLCPLATVPARAGNGGTGSSPVRGHHQNFTKALRAAGRPPVASAGSPPVASGGWLGLSRGHGRRGARRNRGVARRNRAMPALDRASMGWARWNRRPPGGSESLRKIGTMPPHGRRRNGGTGSPPVQGHRQRSLFRREVPYSVVHPAAYGLQRGRATLRRPLAASRRLVEPS